MWYSITHTSVPQNQKGLMASGPVRTHRSRGWCFTQHNLHEVPHWDASSMCYLVYQKEEAPQTKKVHYQGYVYFRNPRNMSAVQALYPGAHLEIAKGSPTDNKTYCTKIETRVEGPWEKGNLPKQGHRSDVDEVLEYLKEGKSDSDILSSCPSYVMRYPSGLKSARFIIMQERGKKWRQVSTEVVWGKTRTGKTSTVMRKFPEAFLWHPEKNKEWWDGYNGETVLLMDDFDDSQIDIVRMLHLLDGYPCRLPVKGGHMMALWDQVFITTNKDPVLWYPHIQSGQREALMARITTITEMTNPEPPTSPGRVTLNGGQLNQITVVPRERVREMKQRVLQSPPVAIEEKEEKNNECTSFSLSPPRWMVEPPNQQEVIPIGEWPDFFDLTEEDNPK